MRTEFCAGRLWLPQYFSFRPPNRATRHARSKKFEIRLRRLMNRKEELRRRPEIPASNQDQHSPLYPEGHGHSFGGSARCAAALQFPRRRVNPLQPGIEEV